MAGSTQKVMIKGTRDGLTLRLDDQCSFQSILRELQEQLSMNGLTDEHPMIRVTIQLGNRYLNDEQKEELAAVIREKQKLVVDRIESDVLTKKEALEWKENTEINPIAKTVRSGQLIEVKGDLLLIGDVNPGGQVQATGNIFVMGSLRGIAHAGYDGDTNAVIAASYMQPSQLRIADQLSRSPDYESEGVYMECGYIDDSLEKILMDRMQEVIKKRPDLVSFERRMING
ncbi:septum site-determining protein MinC [Halobacillus karajensis]|uniref:Probable septum site-determining protein MinC n=1 Tax=Halobacillus karajensis TaxID=195088 RepID=A0A024P5Z5_9BACI|nr:septum site-determining protein MinC [Halobacillus karajensis]CDQ18138.1 Septum site-determining protein MinC [Halobacillus karajensis]CDQ24489.1 Septum site-determining protein MinC [Halobacillus karajensis]CDQ29263.1 Septum site-determining protein MinC [Halobacillus karajensis]SEH58528.1 septum site-determining protein MinC [Halobacillus karajensis]